MAKGIGLIGNFRGKVGNMVGYNLKDSNNKQTQGVRVYQPIVKNPKTYAQANQRAKLAPINATYRALKMIIDRGQEGKAYGNKSRLAWLRDALKSGECPWYEKGGTINLPVVAPISDGTLAFPQKVEVKSDYVTLDFYGEVQAAPTTIASLSTALIGNNSPIKEGDQLTFIILHSDSTGMRTKIASIVVDTTDTSAIPFGFTATTNYINFEGNGDEIIAGAIVLSRTNSNGEHLRSRSFITLSSSVQKTQYEDAAKETAIKSYMAGGSNTDWAEESLQG